ncbi:MAG TPA: hypothetical protein VGP84_23765, partial [Gemmatimonadaceae bacterium]|nr:hypothetical protein [Gemmatimonadaceae bacterium]
FPSRRPLGVKLAERSDRNGCYRSPRIREIELVPRNPISLSKPPLEGAQQRDQRRQIDEPFEQRAGPNVYLDDDPIGAPQLSDELLDAADLPAVDIA